MIGIVAVDALVAIPFAKLRLEKKALTFAAAKILNVLVIVVLNVYFLTFAYDPAIGVAYVFIINLFGNALYFVFFVKTFLDWRPLFDKKIISSMLNYAYPIMITGLAGMPSVNIGMKEVWAPALLADSGPATPASAPLPNSSGRSEARFSIV